MQSTIWTPSAVQIRVTTDSFDYFYHFAKLKSHGKEAEAFMLP